MKLTMQCQANTTTCEKIGWSWDQVVLAKRDAPVRDPRLEPDHLQRACLSSQSQTDSSITGMHANMRDASDTNFHPAEISDHTFRRQWGGYIPMLH